MKLFEAPVRVKMFTLMFLFIQGSTILLNIAPSAGRSSWVSILTATLLGYILVYGYFNLIKNRTDTGYYGLVQEHLGRYAGGLVLYVYVLYFLYLGSRDVRDMVELISNAVLVDTPTTFIAGAFTIVVVYTLLLGMDSLMRISSFYFGLFAFVFILISALIFINKDYDLGELLPVFEYGIGPVMEPAYTQLVFFPFGETLAFMIGALPWIRENFKSARKATLWAVVVGGCTLAAGTALQVITLGIAVKNRSPFPMLGAFRNISVGMFIERVEVLFVFVMLITLTVKVALFLFASVKGMEMLTGLSFREMVIPMGGLLSIQAFFIAGNTAEHFEISYEVVPFYALIMEILIPALLLIITVILRRRGKSV
ncbi:hypothetical protein SY83_03220 [Paenibacillus swuensis]|uniref:Uncharacterized protein n=1 Tax=Paenibacillus swuensis TaxID=1178515 RepID=A0A172TEW3_9BACL|nr:endospore germination permease [Paenibacillus swuensis]ANE45492.1 hypothetical protein SY83_03220 [Paenibacillus swuensis]